MIAAVEDILSELVLRRLVAAIRPELSIDAIPRQGGRVAIRRRARELNQTARHAPVIILADLDRPEPCPAQLVADFLGGKPARHMLFRVVVMEIESWIMADRLAFSAFLRVPIHRIPENTDDILEPKEFIVTLVRKSRSRDIREDLVPKVGSTAKVGPAFNSGIASFVSESWDCSRARHSSSSLSRAMERLKTAFAG